MRCRVGMCQRVFIGVSTLAVASPVERFGRKVWHTSSVMTRPSNGLKRLVHFALEDQCPLPSGVLRQYFFNRRTATPCHRRWKSVAEQQSP